MISIWLKQTWISIFLLSLGITAAQANLSTSTNSSHLQLETAFTAYQQGRYIEAKTIWQNLAEQGIASAQINLAALYDSGTGVAADQAKAAALYLAAASKGNQFAQYNLAVMHIEGRGVSQDLALAERWLEKAAAQKMALAQYQLGLLSAGVHKGYGANGVLTESDHVRIAMDLDRALSFIHQSGLTFDQEADADGLQKAIAAMVRIAPDDPRIDTLRAKLDILQSDRHIETDQSTGAAAFGTAWPLENGYVVTNYHVIAGSREVALQNANGHKIKAWPVLYDQDSDLALLAVEDTSLLPPALPLCSAESPLGSSVFTLGFPRVDVLGYAPTYTDGVIESDHGPLGNQDRYLTTVDIQPGNSGGPLLNSNGEVVGVVTAMLGVRDETTGAVQIMPNQSCAVKTASVQQLIEKLPGKRQSHHTISGQDRSIQTLREQLKDSVLVVIAQGKS